MFKKPYCGNKLWVSKILEKASVARAKYLKEQKVGNEKQGHGGGEQNPAVLGKQLSRQQLLLSEEEKANGRL